ncbi:hypothetical protein R6Q59_019372 [Mikania micrantha]|uniref:Uncharacterized protein n=1 Tax=Mikania micrantha TaxID=192012 RepID=A0A5N6LXR5_9ASTR|nr:hypothetical protein E3N88_34307 [Mikania micrantha]
MADSDKQPQFLFKQHSWSPDIHRDIEWQKLKNNQRHRRQFNSRRKSIDGATEFDVTDDDMKELKACFDLGFGFDPSNDLDPKLAQAFPALELYAAVNRRYNGRLLSRSSSLSSDSLASSAVPTNAIINIGDDPTTVKTKLKQWAQLVSCLMLEGSSQFAMNKHALE